MEQLRVFEGGLNTDDSPETMPSSDYPFLLNGIKAKSYGGFGGTIENQVGTLAIATGVTELDANATCIGGIRDQKNSAWYVFFHNTNPLYHCIVKLSAVTGVTKVMAGTSPAWITGTPYVIGSQVSSGGFSWRSLTNHTDAVVPVEGAIWTKITWGGLQFSLSNLITGGAVVGNVIHWTDNNLGPRSASTTKYAGGIIPVTEEEIKLIKRGGIFATTYVKGTSGGSSNMTGRFGFQFAYQYVYDDNQFSVLSPYSGLCPTNTQAQTFNSIVVTSSDVVPMSVKTIKWAARIGNSGAFFYIGDTQRPASGWAASNSITFYNNANGSAVPDNYSYQFHAVPLKVKCMETAKNRLWLGNYVEGYDQPNNAAFALSAGVSEIPIGVAGTITKDVYKIRQYTYHWTGSFWTAIATALVQDTAPAGDLMIIDPVSTFNRSTFLTEITGRRVILSGNYIDNASTAMPVYSMSNPPSGFTALNHINFDHCVLELYAAAATYSVGIISGDQYEGKKTFASGSSFSVGYILKDEDGIASGVTGPQGFNSRYDAYFNKLTLGWDLPTLWDDTIIYAWYNPLTSRVIYQGNLWTVKNGVTATVGVPPSATQWDLQPNPFPSWARSYSIVMTKNLSKSMLIESRAADVGYSKTLPAGTTIYHNYDASNDDIVVDITPLQKSGLGYEWQAGDRIVLYPTIINGVACGIGGQAPVWVSGTYYYSGDIVQVYTGSTVYRYRAGVTGTSVVTPVGNVNWTQLPPISVDLPIRSFDGVRLHLPNVCIGNFVIPCKANFEIYRPAEATAATLYYEIGQTFPIVFDSAGYPAFSVCSSQIDGDCVETVRPCFQLNVGVYELDPNQKFALFKATSLDPLGNWDTDIGKPYVVTTIGQVTKSNFFKFSSTVINGTSVNGLSEFYFLDEDSVAQEDGPMYKLKATAREKDEATVLLAICRNGASSIYIDQAQMNLDQTTSFLIQAANVVGGEKHLVGGYGTINPESVFDLNDDVYWYDAINGRFIRYAANGLFAISDFKMIHHFEDMRVALKATPARVVTGYDPFYRLLYNSCSSSAANRKTVSWNEGAKRWISFHSIVADWYFDIEGVGYSVKGGTFYSHNNTAAFNTFHGVVYDTVLELNFNDHASAPKYWSVVSALLSKNFWTWTAGEQVIAASTLKFELENSFGQATDIQDGRWDFDENLAYGAIFKDKNTAGVANPYVDGDDMFSHIALGRLTITGKPSDVFKRINFVKLGYELSKGHTL